ncbi:MAG: RCC1 repeat-containing protein, partial [Chloroflexi bacterium]|nr:RCC1 repeat-containing protein [Chloroflexota bacterium]
MFIPILLGSGPVAAAGVVAIAAGSSHPCAVTSDGGLVCWGLNDLGQLGSGTGGGSQPSPTIVQGLSDAVTAASLGDAHTCALTTAGNVLCWGDNDAGQLGDGTSGGIRATPVAVSGLEGAVSVAAGFLHTCALTTEGGVKCWGSNFFGQLGTGGGAAESALPVDVSGLTSGVAAIAAGGYHTCAVTLAGGVVCWGRNDHGQLGDGADSPAASTPVDV